jgi:predicted transcriptional regulator
LFLKDIYFLTSHFFRLIYLKRYMVILNCMAETKSKFQLYIEGLEASIKADIIESLKKEEPLTITAISVRANISRNTTTKRLFELVAEGKVVLREIEGGTKLFFLNPEFEKEEPVL